MSALCRSMKKGYVCKYCNRDSENFAVCDLTHTRLSGNRCGGTYPDNKVAPCPVILSEPDRYIRISTGQPIPADDMKSHLMPWKASVNRDDTIHLYCNECKHLSITEEEQDTYVVKPPHICNFFHKTVKHYNHHPNISRLPECQNEYGFYTYPEGGE